MATINNLYVHVVDEDWDKDVNSTSHPVEKGIDLTDTIRPKPVVLTLSGNIVNFGTTKAETILSKIEELKTKGSLITYVGRRTMSGLQIQTFKTSHPNTIWGGCKFEMELKEVRIAKKAYTAPQTSSKTSTGSLKVGSKVVFKGGNVYVASDSKKPSSKRSRCTCTITKISTHSWSIHKYHLYGGSVSNRVYGWVDGSTIETTATASNTTVRSNVKGGVQQINDTIKMVAIDGSVGVPSKNSQTPKWVEVWHTVKDGDTLYKLVNETYKDLDTSEEFIIKNNPDTVKRVTKGYDVGSMITYRTTYELTVSKKILVGRRKVS